MQPVYGVCLQCARQQCTKGSCIALKCVRWYGECSSWWCLFPVRSFITPPAICFILSNVSNCISAGGSNVALCVPAALQLWRCTVWSLKQPAGVCVRRKALCPWAWHQSPSSHWIIAALQFSVCKQRMNRSDAAGEGCEAELIILKSLSKFRCVSKRGCS